MKADQNIDHEVLIQYLIDTLPCSECGGTYRRHDVFVVDEDDTEAWTLIALCSHCGAETVVKAFMDPAYNHAAVDEEPPTIFEIDAWRDFLAQFDGDMDDLLRY